MTKGLASSTLISPGALRINDVRLRLLRSFEEALGAEPEWYEWRWVPEGEPLFYDEWNEPVLADFDMVEIYALSR